MLSSNLTTRINCSCYKRKRVSFKSISLLTLFKPIFIEYDELNTIIIPYDGPPILYVLPFSALITNYNKNYAPTLLSYWKSIYLSIHQCFVLYSNDNFFLKCLPKCWKYWYKQTKWRQEENLLCIKKNK